MTGCCEFWLELRMWGCEFRGSVGGVRVCGSLGLGARTCVSCVSLFSMRVQLVSQSDG